MKKKIGIRIKKFKNNVSKSKKKKYLLTLGLISLFLLTDITNSINLVSKFEITSFEANRYQCDVHEEVIFSWKVRGNYSVAWILYGDGTREKFNNSITSTKHKYEIQGKFKVTLFVQYLGISGVETISKSLPQLIVVKNEAPGFDITVSNTKPYEDEEVLISVPQSSLKESSYDKQPGVLTYIFNTGDSTETGQITTNKSSILYKWKNAGTYPVGVYVIDDQGALTQKTKYIEVINNPPKAFYTIKSNPEEWFGVGMDLSKSLTYSFEDGQIPSGWSHENTYASIVPFNNGPNKVLKLHGRTNSSSPLKSQGITCDISPQTSGTIEFSFYKASGSAGFIFSLVSESFYWDFIWNDHLLLRFDYNNSGKIEIKNDYLPSFHPNFIEHQWKTITKMTTHAWYKIRVDFRYDNDDKYMGLKPGYINVWINGEKLVSNYQLRCLRPYLQYIQFSNWDYGKDITYIDDVIVYPEATIGYSEKSNIQFSAEGSQDSPSDLDSLNYIWDFGDNSIDFGKLVSHSYLNSGVYNVTLYVKDDNGAIDHYSQTIYIHNQYPDVDLTIQDQKIVINEGETVIFNSQCIDDSTDFPRLSYWYGFNDPAFDPTNLEDFEKGGSIKSHLYTDDYSGKAGVMVIDPENAYDFDFTDIVVKNVNPSLDIWDACIMTNMSIEVHRNDANHNANFTFEFRTSNESVLTYSVSFNENDDLLVSYNKSLFSISLRKQWKVIVNSTTVLPENSWFQAHVKFEFLNGKELILSSDKLYGGSYGYWELDLNQFLYNKKEYTVLYPITFNASVWDPSVDDIEINLYYNVEILLEINCSNSLPMYKKFSEEFDFILYTNVFEQNQKIYAKTNIFEIVRLSYHKNNTFPVNFDFSFNIFPFYDGVCQNLTDFFENKMKLLDFQIIRCVGAHHVLNGIILDDDGGKETLTFEFDMENGIEFKQFSPRIIPIIPFNNTVNDDVFISTVIYDLNLINVTAYNLTHQITADFGYNSKFQHFDNEFDIVSNYYLLNYGNLTFDCEGEYLIIIKAQDPYDTTKNGGLINIFCPSTYGTIRNFPNTAIQNRMIHFSSEFHAHSGNESNLIYMWSFGDGSFAFCRNPSHAWNKPGVYNITLLTVDCYGHVNKDIAIIRIQEQPPQICGPFTFHGVEGQAIILDLEIHDAFIDELTLNYFWYDSNNILISMDKKPILILKAGSYCYTLIVKDEYNQTAEAEISVFIENAAPLVFVSNYMYNGAPGEKLILDAYGFDSFFDNGNLNYYWTIYNDDNNYTISVIHQGTYCSIEFLCERTFVYQGQVKIIDSSGNIGIATFSINSFIDTNGNGISDEFERQLLIFGEEITSYSDVDNDGLIDLFEIGVSKTSYTDPDTDKDGLVDGIDFSTGIGELTIGTDPLNYDSDGDMLSDGFEFFGWEFTSDIYGTLNISSNPIDIDTDRDKFSDYQEYLSGTDPRNPDSDGDLLIDGEDPFPLIIDGDRDGLTDYEEWRIGTNLNSSDSDNDGLSDGQEVKGWHFKTNPLSIDSDHDFLADSAEYKTYTCSSKWNENGEYIGDKRVELNKDIYLLFEERIESATTAEISFDISFGEFGSTGIIEYGIKNVPGLEIIIAKDDLILFNMTTNRSRYISHAIDIREIMENNTMKYNGKYYIRINNTQAKCILERFQIEVTTFLDPNNPDFDGDKILDGVETSLLVKGKNIIDFKDVYNNNSLVISEDLNNKYYNEFCLDIPSLGIVYNAKLVLMLTSTDLLNGHGRVAIELVKVENNCSVEDISLIEISRPFIQHNEFYHMIFLDLSDYLANNQYYGTYELKISIFDTNVTHDAFILSEFYIETDTFILASPSDTNAWITNPAQKDTDGDTLIDSYEIEKGWNPLSVDTDADGVWDNVDNDPLHDLIIEVELVSATGGKDLKAGVFYSQNNEKIGIWTPESDGLLNYKYYIDINDVRDYIYFNFQLYEMGYTYKKEEKKEKTIWEKIWYYILGWIYEEITKVITEISEFTVPDTKLGSWNHKYTVGAKNDKTFHGALFNHDKTLRVKIKTIPLSRTNTIAVFQKNSSFNGHYSQQERMGVLQLYINEDGNGTPFQKGLNTILIPTHLFTNTILNGRIQRQQLEATPLIGCEFASIERDDQRKNEITSEYVDFVIIKSDLSATQAMEILDLVLNCVINQTTNETAILHSYVSTKLNGTKAEQMNLHSEVLKLIPFFSNYKNSPQSSRPATFLETLVKNLVDLTTSIVKFIISLTEGITKVIQTIKKAIEKIALVVLSFIANLLYLLIRAALLILIYAMLALEILTIATIFTAVGLTFNKIGSFPGLSTNYQIQWYADYGKDTRIGFLDIEVFENDISVEGWILWDYWSFFDLFIPYSDMKFDTGFEAVANLEEPEYDPEIEDPVAPELHCGFDQIDNTLKYDFHTVYEHLPNQSPEYVNLTLISPLGNSYEYTLNISKTAIYSQNWFDKLFTLLYWEDLGFVYDENENSFNPHDIWSLGVRHNITINFEKEFTSQERHGQWFYRFHSNATKYGCIGSFPRGYLTLPGPSFFKPIDFLLYSNLNPYAGKLYDNFTFSVTGCDFLNNSMPENVALIIDWDNNTYQAFTMEKSTYYNFDIGENISARNITLTTYELTLNFSHYLNITEITYLHYYFKAEFADGRVSTLWDYVLNEDTEEYEEQWFEGPRLSPDYGSLPPDGQGGSFKPKIEYWAVELVGSEEMYDIISLQDSVLGPFYSEQIIRFWVYVEDPDGSHEHHCENGFEFKPELNLINLDHPDNPLDPIEMEFTGGHYGPGPSGYNEYFVDVLGSGQYTYEHDDDFESCDFGPGAWTFRLKVKDNCSNSDEKDAETVKIWHTGSLNSFVNTLMYGSPDLGRAVGDDVGGLAASISVSTAYIATGIASMAGEKGKKIAQIIALGLRGMIW